VTARRTFIIITLGGRVRVTRTVRVSFGARKGTFVRNTIERDIQRPERKMYRKTNG